MGITIHPLEESDIPTFVRLELDAFRPHPRIPMLWPHGYTPDLHAYMAAGKAQHFHEPGGRMIKAVDEHTGRIVGCAEVSFALDVRENEKEDVVGEDAAAPEGWPRGGNWAMKRWFLRNSFELVRGSFGVGRCIVVDILVVDPEWQGRGIGFELLQWAVREADERGVPVGLESTPAGLSLYKRHGFVEAKTIKADMKMFGWDQPYDEEAAKRVWMVRPARDARAAS